MTLVGISIEDRLKQPQKQLLPNEVTLLGMIIDDNFEQS